RAARAPGGGGSITMVVTGNAADYSSTLYASVLDRNYGRTRDAFLWMFTHHTPADYEALITTDAAHRYQIVTSDPAMLAAMRDRQARRPDLGLAVVDLRTIPDR